MKKKHSFIHMLAFFITLFSYMQRCVPLCVLYALPLVHSDWCRGHRCYPYLRCPFVMTCRPAMPVWLLRGLGWHSGTMAENKVPQNSSQKKQTETTQHNATQLQLVIQHYHVSDTAHIKAWREVLLLKCVSQTWQTSSYYKQTGCLNYRQCFSPDVLMWIYCSVWDLLHSLSSLIIH